MTGSPPPPGVYVPVPTFYVGKQAASYDPVAAPLDPETQAAHGLYLARAGIKGLVVLGSTGEAIHLTSAERDAVLAGLRRAFDDAGFPGYPLIAGTAAQNVEETVAQLRGAADAGAQWGLCLAPGYFAAASSQEGVARWFEAVADRSPIPVMIYHYPGVSNNVKVSPATFARLSKHPNIVGCKLSHGDMSHHAQIAASPDIDAAGFATFTGLGQQLLPAMMVGCAGTIDGCAGFFPKTVVELYRRSAALAAGAAQWSADEARTLRRLQCKVSRAEELVVQFGTVGIKEAVSRLRGFGDRDGTRLPLCGGMGDAAWDAWHECFDDLEEEEKRL
ncbi:aldolase [Xylariaceae sp. FL0804]|nr:aldolase [Xylariaceae sp. FL0804]